MASFNCSSVDISESSDVLVNCIESGICNQSSSLQGNNDFQAVDMCLGDEQYLFKYLGHRRSPDFLPVCVSYLLIFLVGAVGNALTCTVIARNKVMWTPTNYYLFSLAVSDLLVLIFGMPLELYDMWSNYPFLFGEGGCYFKIFLLETVCFASILNVTALSVERYIAVVHPLRAKYVVTRAHAKRVILTVWALSMICAVPNTSLHGIVTLPPRFGHQYPESAICTLVKPQWMYNLLIQVTTLLFFLLPMLTISVLYLLIGLQLRRERMLIALEAKSGLSHRSYSGVHSQQQRVRHQQVTKMLCVLVIVFGICWAPFHTDRLVWSFISSWTIQLRQIFQYIHLISGFFFYLSSAVNPILYNLMSTRFRDMFREVTCKCVCARRRCPPNRSPVTHLTLRSTVYDVPPGNSAPNSEGENCSKCTGWQQECETIVT